MTSAYSPLGVELMVTGENAGTWGTKTNTNLSLISQLFGGFNSQSIAGGAQTTALTVVDGKTMYSSFAPLSASAFEFPNTSCLAISAICFPSKN